MSRDMKFRAWNKNTKKMVCPHKLTPLALHPDCVEMKGVFIPFHDDYILMQYTGLKDKNGKEIYEGNIVKEGGIVSVIEWAQPNARFCYRTETGTVGLYGFYGEIIGNIYENNEIYLYNNDNTPPQNTD